MVAQAPDEKYNIQAEHNENKNRHVEIELGRGRDP
jgi:hypothetical protein